MAINKHGYKMVGLKKASGATENYGIDDGRYNEIWYDKNNGKVWAQFCFISRSVNWSKCNAAAISVCTTSHRMSMQAIADAIANAIANGGSNELFPNNE